MDKARAKEDEQGYLVSVSDMMAGLLFLFIIVLMVFVINFHLQKMKTEDIQRDLTDTREVRKQLLEDLKESLEREGVIVRIDVERGLLHVPEDILFKFGRTEFQEGGERSLTILARNLASRLPCYAGKRGSERSHECDGPIFKPGRLEAVLVEGHTDNVPVRSKLFQDNWDLSAKRSIVTYQYLLEDQPILANLTNADGEPLFGVCGYADTRPVIRHFDIKDEPQNRRIDLRFILAPPDPNSSGGREEED